MSISIALVVLIPEFFGIMHTYPFGQQDKAMSELDLGSVLDATYYALGVSEE